MIESKPIVMRRGLLLGTVVLAMIVAILAGAASASAEVPWWKLSQVSDPGNLKAGQAKNETQTLTVSATGGSFVLVEQKHFKFEFFPWNATHQEVQEGLERIYGEGNVEVSGGPGDEEGTKPYVITFVGALAYKPVERINAEFSSEFLSCEGATGPNCKQQASIEDTVKGHSDGLIVLLASNVGDAKLTGSKVPVTLTEKLPAGLKAVGISSRASYFLDNNHGAHEPVCSLSTVSCTYTAGMAPYEGILVLVSVNVEPGAQSGETIQANASGGDAPDASVSRPITISDSPTPFGVENYELAAEEEGGAIDTQAGSHPFQLTTTLMFNEGALAQHSFDEGIGMPVELGKDLHFKLPPGLIGNPSPFPQCTLAQFLTSPRGRVDESECTDKTILGMAKILVNVPSLGDHFLWLNSPIWNLEPQHGEPARFGFVIAATPVILDTAVRTGSDYGVTVSTTNIPEMVNFLGSQVTFWGVPGDRRHDNVRGASCFWRGIEEEKFIEEGRQSELDQKYPCNPVNEESPPPFLELPTSCTGPLQTSVQADSWKHPETVLATGPSVPLPAMDGCNRLPFSPSISVAPDAEAASTPTGLTVGVHVPQEVSLNAEGLGEADVKDTTVTLPAGVALNPAAADGLQSCSEGQVSLGTGVVPSCPDASKVATLEIKSPLLPNPLTGEAYLAAQNANPFGSLLALYLVAQDPVSGTLVKLAGEVKPDPVTGQLVSTFKDTPQLPFEDLKLHFFGGARAPLASPATCGAYTTTATIAGWSGNPPATPSSTFQIATGPNNSGCMNPLPFTPELSAGSTNIQAGAFTPFTMTMSRQDGQQNLDAIQLHMPPGLLGTLATVKLCDEASANAGTCGADSLIGHTIVSVGLGDDPFSVTGGRVYITEGYKGAPYGLSVVNPAKAGPFDLGQVVVRAKLEVDPVTAAITVTTDKTGSYAIPQIIDGIPLQIKHVNVSIDRPGFTFNPTNCEPQKITGALTSSSGAEAGLAIPFQVTNCATLKFKPQFKVSTNGKTSRAKGASLTVKLAYPKAPWGTLSNIRYVKVSLPKQLPSRLSTLQKACPDTTFDANPAACPAESRIGTANATTPILPVPLSGPAYFVSHGGAKFPELVIVLSGYGTTVYLHGETFISTKGITSSTFNTIPDVPIGTFELKLPQGPYSALAANGNLCTAHLKMPTIFKAQNGLELHQATPIAPTGCAKHKAHHKKHRHKKRKKHKRK